MMRRLLMLFVSFLASVFIFAEGIDKTQALRKAQEFMPGKNFQEVKSISKARGDAFGDAFYVFNAEKNGGFVIVSGDDRTVPILGYSRTGSIDMEKMPENMKWWLEGYAHQIEALGTSVKPAQRTKTRGVDSWSAINPLIQTKWNQFYPYNKMCPDKNGYVLGDAGFDTAHLMTDDQKNYHCVTGCVATAMAQVMFFWRQSLSSCLAIPAYTTESNIWAMKDLPATSFEWDKMKETYNGNETDESADAVAELMRYCGQAVEMDYNLYVNGGSSAGVSPYHMAHYFGFGKNARDVMRYNYPLAVWESMIYEEVSNGRPVLYSGASNSGGHRFIVDGYDGNGLFHMNWGWGGMSDGYYVLSLADPDELGAGGGTSKDGYSKDQHAIIGLIPDDGEAEKPQFYAGFCGDLEQSEFSRGTANVDFTGVELPGCVFFQYSDPSLEYGVYTCTFEVGWGLYKDGSLLKVLGKSGLVTLGNNYYGGNWTSFSFGSGLADGEYQFRQVYRLQDSEEWQLCEMLGITFVNAVILGNKLTLRQSLENEYSSNVAINGVTFSPSEFEVGKPVEVTVNLTNNGDSYQELICFWDGNERASLVCGSVESGKTGEVKLHFMPKNSGTITFSISTDAVKTLSSANVIWSKEVTVSAAKPQSLTGTIEAVGITSEVGEDYYYHYYLHGKNLKLKVDVNNTGVNTFDDQVVLILYKLTPGTNMGNQYASKSVAVKIEPGETKQVDFAINDLDPANSYFFKLFYNSAAKQTEMNCPDSMVGITFQIVDALLGDADGSGGVDADDIKAVVRYIMEGDFEGFVFDNADVVKDGKVNAADLVKIIDMVGNP